MVTRSTILQLQTCLSTGRCWVVREENIKRNNTVEKPDKSWLVRKWTSATRETDRHLLCQDVVPWEGQIARTRCCLRTQHSTERQRSARQAQEGCSWKAKQRGAGYFLKKINAVERHQKKKSLQKCPGLKEAKETWYPELTPGWDEGRPLKGIIRASDSPGTRPVAVVRSPSHVRLCYTDGTDRRRRELPASVPRLWRLSKKRQKVLMRGETA